MSAVPAKLYKYCKAEDGLRIIRSAKVRFTQPDEFNDPFDHNPYESVEEDIPVLVAAKLKMDEPELKKRFAFDSEPDYKQYERKHRARLEALIRKQKPRLSEAWKAELNRRFGVFCLSEVRSSLLMWAHYAKDHTGCVIEFCFSGQPLACFAKEPLAASDLPRKVTYTQQRPQLSLKNPRTEWVYMKSPEWAYEREWRMVGDFGMLEKTEVPERTSPIYLGQLPPQTIESVTLGARMGERDVVELKAAVRTPDRRHIQLHKATLHAERYELVFTSIR